MANESTLTKMVKNTFFELMKDVGTSIPGHILAFDTDSQLAQCQIGVQKTVVGGRTVTPSPIIECPVFFAGGSDYFVEHKLSSRDEGVIFFSQRCIDGWRETGGVAVNPITRFHDMNDAFFLPGFRSKGNSISDFTNDGIRIRNADGSGYVWLKDDGKIYIKGDVIVEGDVVADGISLKTHGTSPGTFNVNGTPVAGEGGAPT